MVVGPDVEHRFFYEQVKNPRGDVVRYFGGGSEIVLNPEGVRFQGNGGIFGEYMFGGHLPVGDLLNDEVVNRLVMFGATTDPKSGDLRFTYNTTGFENYDNLFLQGNAIANYVFFLDDRKRYDDITDRQSKTLRSAGKLMKRSRKVGAGQFIGLAHEILDSLGEPESTLVMLRVVNLANQRFAETCRQAYAEHIDVESLIGSDDELGRVEAYQRERIQIDVIYHDPANQELIDEYKRILASCAGSIISPSARARLMRIRTLSLRNEVPLSIFDTLEDILLQEPRTASQQAEPEYIESTREILGGFLLGKNIRRKLSSLDMVQLMENKQKAAANRDQTFEELLEQAAAEVLEDVHVAEERPHLFLGELDVVHEGELVDERRGVVDAVEQGDQLAEGLETLEVLLLAPDLVDEAAGLEQKLLERLIAVGSRPLLVLHQLHEVERRELPGDVPAEKEAAEDLAGGLDVVGLVFLADRRRAARLLKDDLLEGIEDRERDFVAQ